MKTPNAIIMIPPTWLNPASNDPADVESTLFRITPRTEKTIVKPATKNNVFSIMFSLLATRFTVPLFFCSSVKVVPEIYARNAGIIGKIHGARKDPSPAMAAMPMVSSTMIS